MVRTPKDYPWKVLDTIIQDLSDGLQESDIKYAMDVSRSRDIQRYYELSEAWSPQSMGGQSGITKSEFISKYQISALLKKYLFPGDSELRKKTAKETFLAAELACKDFNLVKSKSLACLHDEEDLAVFTHARIFLERLLGFDLPEPDKLTLWSRHGPGANLDTEKRRTSLYDKYKNWPYSCTSGALGHARSLIQSDERWLGALEDSYRRKYNIPFFAILNQKTFWSNVLKVVPGNRITFVPKNGRTDRSIAIEPCMNLCLQLGVDGYIRRRLKRWGIDLDSQEKNQNLAGLGSLHWDDPESFATLDLAAASDSISIELCRLLLPVPWYNYLMDLRSPVGDLDGESIQFEKISSMGNGYTFALESAVFAAAIYGSLKATGQAWDASRIAVFGDDLIVPRSAVARVTRTLNLFGFTINDSKSFTHGKFRESCGADWFEGTPVRPVFLSELPTTVMGIWCDSNRIRRFLSLRVGKEESGTERLIDKWIPPVWSSIVGPPSDTEFDSYKHSMHRPRYKEGLWGFNRLVLVPKRLKGDEFLFRKLMHQLRSSPNANHTVSKFSRKRWGGAFVDSGGNVFDITAVNAVTPCVTPSWTSVWSREYVDQTTMGFPS